MSAVVTEQAPLLRPMREHDLVHVLEVEQRAYEFPWTLGIFGDCLRAGYCCWSLVVGETVLGYAIMVVTLDEAHILNICIDPGFHRRGHAQRLLDHLLALAVRHGASMVFLEVRPTNVAARHLYTRNGFSQIALRRGYYPARVGREDALVLSKNFPLPH